MPNNYATYDDPNSLPLRNFQDPESLSTQPQDQTWSNLSPRTDPSITAWHSEQGVGPTLSGIPLGSICGCGNDCRCPGCSEHNGATTDLAQAFSSCANPGVCGVCLNCSVLAFQSLAPDTALSIYDLQSPTIDEWIRQLSSASDEPPMANEESPVYPMPRISDSFEKGESLGPSDGGADCVCAPGFCNCELGNSDRHCLRLPGLRFVVSGERGSCVDWKERQAFDGVSALGSPIYESIPTTGGDGFLAVPDMQRSRSSSTSSRSSHFSSGQMSVDSGHGSSFSGPIDRSTLTSPIDPSMSGAYSSAFRSDSDPANYSQYDSSLMY